MSEHLFKAKDAETKKWVQGYLWSERTIGVTSPCGNVDEVVVDPDTVCQYIGRTDRTGKKIFENDMILAKNEIGEVYCFVVRYGICGGVKNVRHDVGYMGFYLGARDMKTNRCLEGGVRNDIVFWLNECHCEVVGNIYDETEVSK